MPSRARAAGAAIVPSAPVSRIKVTGPRPSIRALTRMGAPGVKAMRVGPAGSRAPDRRRAPSRYASGTLSTPVE